MISVATRTAGRVRACLMSVALLAAPNFPGLTLFSVVETSGWSCVKAVRSVVRGNRITPHTVSLSMVKLAARSSAPPCWERPLSVGEL